MWVFKDYYHFIYLRNIKHVEPNENKVFCQKENCKYNECNHSLKEKRVQHIAIPITYTPIMDALHIKTAVIKGHEFH